MATTEEQSGQLDVKDIQNICGEPAEEPANKLPIEGPPDKLPIEGPPDKLPIEGPPDKPPAKKPTILKTCELCNVTLISQSSVDAHMASKKHTKKVQAAESMKGLRHAIPNKEAPSNTSKFRCDICNVTLNSLQQQEFHLAGTKHAYKVKKHAESFEFNQGNAAILVENPAFHTEGVASASNLQGGFGEVSTPVEPTDLSCSVCNITVNSVQQLTQHLSSKKHQLKEESVRQEIPYSRSGRGGPGRGGRGARGMRGAQGAQRGAGGGAGGRGRWGGPQPGGGNLKSNFQSAGFISNFQPSGGMKRDHSPRNSFGNGNNDQFSNSRPRGRKMARGSHAPFSNQSFTDQNNSFRSGNNSFGSSVNSFGGVNSSFGGGDGSFGGGNNLFGGGNNSFGGGNNSFGGGNSSFGGGNDSFGNNSFRGVNNSFRGGKNSFRGGNNSSRGSNNSFRGGNNSLRGGNSTSRGGNSTFRGGNSTSRGGTSTFRGGNSSRGGNNSSRGGISSLGGKSGSFRGGKSLPGRGFPPRGRGKTSGGPQRGNISRGRGGGRGGFGVAAQGGGFGVAAQGEGF